MHVVVCRGHLDVHAHNARDPTDKVADDQHLAEEQDRPLKYHDTAADRCRDRGRRGAVHRSDGLLDCCEQVLVGVQEDGEQVTAGHDADQPTVVLDHWQSADVPLVQYPRCLAERLLLVDGHRGRRHDLARRQTDRMHSSMVLESRPHMLCSQFVAQQVAHCDYAEHMPQVIDPWHRVHMVIPDRADELTEGRFGTLHPYVSGPVSYTHLTLPTIL